MIALATSQVAIRDAEKSIAQAQVPLSEERAELLTAQVTTAELTVESAAKELRRLRQLSDRSPEVKERISTADAAHESAQALLKEAQAKESVGKAEVVLEKAKLKLIQKTLADAELHLSQLKARAAANASVPPN